jgi:hypothetical protein
MRPSAVISGFETSGILTAFWQAACAFCTKLLALPLSAIPLTHFCIKASGDEARCCVRASADRVCLVQGAGGARDRLGQTLEAV